MGVAAIILTKNSESTIRECLDSVSQNNPEEIIVVDGNSGDGTLDIVAEYTDKVFCDEGKGITYARQLGAELAKEEYILYVDSDVVLLANTLETMLADLTTRGYAAICARVLRDVVIRTKAPGEVTATIPMFCTLFPRRLILKYGFDPAMPDCDDFEISYQLQKDGHKIAVSSAYAHHKVKDLKTSTKHIYRCGMALAEFLLKYKKSPPIVFKYVIFRGLGSLVHEILLCIVKGELKFIPRLLLLGLFEIAGFTMKLLNTLLVTTKLIRR